MNQHYQLYLARQRQYNRNQVAPSLPNQNLYAPSAGLVGLAPIRDTRPLLLLTSKAHDTFTKIKNCDDYSVIKGDLLDNRYRVLHSVGRGSFGQVVEAIDESTEQRVAVKIIRKRSSFYKQGKFESSVLQQLNAMDSNDTNHIVYELLSVNLYTLLKMTKFVGLPLEVIQCFAAQILTCLRFLSCEDVGIIHCDVKPENVLLTEKGGKNLKVVDFGSSCRVNERSRFYRAPEVILQLDYDGAIDMWSLGCMLSELYTGKPLFNGRNEKEQLRYIARVLGPVPSHILSSATSERLSQLEFENNFGIGEGLFPIHEHAYRSKGGMGTPATLHHFVHLLGTMLEYDPKRRITAEKALNHPFLHYAIPANDTTPTRKKTADLSTPGGRRKFVYEQMARLNQPQFK